MPQDHEELVDVITVMARVTALPAEEEAHPRTVYDGPRATDVSAGGPSRTMIGIQMPHGSAKDQMERTAKALGYVTAGLDERARRALTVARLTPVGLPSGVNRMARPLGARTVRALEMTRDIGAFFQDDLATGTGICLAAPEATWPPADWDACRRARTNATED